MLMFKKITGLLILLSFFMVKSTPLFAVDEQSKKPVTFHSASDTEKTTESEKENKQLEVGDEDFIDQPVGCLPALTLSKKVLHLVIPQVSGPYISLPYPPPNL